MKSNITGVKIRPFCGAMIIEIRRAKPMRGGFVGVDCYNISRNRKWADKLVELWEAQ